MLVYKDKTQTTTTDTGTDVRKVSDGELLTEAVLNRPSGNLESRTDEVKKYLDIQQHMRSLEESRSTSVVEVNNDGSIEGEGFFSLTKQDGTYFVLPAHFLDTSNTLDYRVLISSGIEVGGFYNIKRLAFETFYTEGVQSDYNPAQGLETAGQTISLRTPMYGTAERSGSTKELPASSSGVTPLREASVPAGTSLATYLSTAATIIDSNTTQALYKSPTSNTIRITLDPMLSEAQIVSNLLKALVEGQVDVFTLTLEGDTTETYTLATDTIEYSDPSNLYTVDITTSSYETILLPLSISDTSITYSGSTYTLPLDSTFSIQFGAVPPGDVLIPLFSHAGDRIKVHGVGSVLISDIDAASAADLPIMLRSDGLVFRLLSTEVDKRTTQHLIGSKIPHGVEAYHANSGSNDLINHTTGAHEQYLYRVIDVELPGTNLSHLYRLASVRLRNVSTGYGNKSSDLSLGVYYLMEDQTLGDPIATTDKHTLLAVGPDLYNFPAETKLTLPWLLSTRTAPAMVSGDSLLVVLAHTDIFSQDYGIKFIIELDYEQVLETI
jgi:hypothetical protein